MDRAEPAGGPDPSAAPAISLGTEGAHSPLSVKVPDKLGGGPFALGGHHDAQLLPGFLSLSMCIALATPVCLLVGCLSWGGGVEF